MEAFGDAVGFAEPPILVDASNRNALKKFRLLI
jgi:hypothetical protein